MSWNFWPVSHVTDRFSTSNIKETHGRPDVRALTGWCFTVSHLVSTSRKSRRKSRNATNNSCDPRVGERERAKSFTYWLACFSSLRSHRQIWQIEMQNLQQKSKVPRLWWQIEVRCDSLSLSLITAAQSKKKVNKHHPHPQRRRRPPPPPPSTTTTTTTTTRRPPPSWWRERRERELEREMERRTKKTRRWWWRRRYRQHK